MDGGKLKGVGAYGCVFQPPLNCKYKETKINENENEISKLTTNEEAMREINISNYIENNLKNYKNYTLIWRTHCTPSKKQIDKDIHNCPLSYTLLKNNEKLSLLITSYGGSTFESRLKTIINNFKKGNNKDKEVNFIKNYSNMIKEVSYLFEGISEFYENNFIHNDIKEQNILRLIKNVGDLERGLRFIDFGLSAVLGRDNLFMKQRAENMFNEQRWYYPYPPEFLYCMGDTQDLQKEYETESFRKRMLYKNIRNVHVKIVKTCKTNKEFDDIIKNIILKARDNDYSNKETLEKIFMKIDVYSLAMSFIFLLIYFEKHNSTKIIKKVFNRNKRGTLLGDFRLLLKKMLDLDYIKRINATDAREEYQKIMDKKYSPIKKISKKTNKKLKKKKSKNKKKKN